MMLEEKIMKKIAIIYHSAKGHTREIAKAVYAGALKVPSIECALIEITADYRCPWDVLAQTARQIQTKAK
jgi:hypothetical protein